MRLRLGPHLGVHMQYEGSNLKHDWHKLPSFHLSLLPEDGKLVADLCILPAALILLLSGTFSSLAQCQVCVDSIHSGRLLQNPLKSKRDLIFCSGWDPLTTWHNSGIIPELLLSGASS